MKQQLKRTQSREQFETDAIREQQLKQTQSGEQQLKADTIAEQQLKRIDASSSCPAPDYSCMVKLLVVLIA